MQNIEDIYTLSPMQQGMLFHTVMNPKSGVYFEQLNCHLKGKLNISAFERAWQQVVNRHSVFRTAFVWEDVDEPVQVVYKEVEIKFNIFDWKNFIPEEQDEKLKSLLDEDLDKGLDLTDVPLMRLFLIEKGKDNYHFVWTHHHLLVDGWTLPLVLKEVFTFYEAYRLGKDVYLEPSRPYRDYIAWLQNQDTHKAESFWRKNLKSFTTPTPLKFDKTPAEVSTRDGYFKENLFIAPKLSSKLDSITREHKITLNTLFQAAWGFLLHIYTGEDDVVFGVTLSGRPTDLPGVESMVGLFINTLPMRQRIVPEKSLLDHLKELQLEHTQARQYEYCHLIQIQGWSDVPRGMPLFESIMVFENYPVDSSVQQQNMSLELSDVYMFERTNYPLTFVVSPGRQMNMVLSYEEKYYQQETVRRILKHLQNILQQMVSDIHQPLSNLSVLDEDEKRRQLVEWNDTRVDFPQNEYLHQMFESQVEKIPENIAVRYKNEKITYRELNQKANQLAHYLQRIDVGPDVMVGVCIERSIEMIVALLGILKAGGNYVPMDPTYPKDRLEYMMEDSGTSVLLTKQKLKTRFSSQNVTAICLDSDWDTISSGNETGNPTNILHPENLAYVIYTSGSTGRPKGTLIEHGGLTNYLRWCLSAYPIETGGDSLVHSSISFDATITSLFSPLLVGGTVRLLPDEEDIEELIKALQTSNENLSLLKITPAHLKILSENLAPEKAKHLTRSFIIGGENLLSEQISFWQQNAPDILLVNEYGPTETVVGSCVYKVPPSRKMAGSIPIGRPIINTQLYILDPDLRPVPVGISGELYIAGVGVARGYLGRPELTAEKFIPNPFVEKSGSRMYKTGDIVRYSSDGNIEFIGRIDNQVKIRSYRVELGEIEAILSQHSAIKEVAVLAREDTPGDKRLVAYFVALEDRIPNITELRDFLLQKIPDYLVPSAFVALDEMPLTPNGKIDRRALPAPGQTRSDLLDSYIAPRTPVEELLANIWSEVLGADQVSVFDNFFELGGHSLLGTQLISRIRDAFQIEVPLNSIFESSNLATLAERIESAQRSGEGVSIPNLEKISREGKLSLSFAQHRLWFLDQLEPGGFFYNIPNAFRLKGKLNVSALESSFNKIVERHEILRTTFTSEEGKPIQVVDTSGSVEIPLVDLTDRSQNKRESETRKLAIEEARQPFDLAHGPLLRTKLLKIEEEDFVLLITMHHIISDGWSTGIFIKELVYVYEALIKDKPIELSHLPVQYADFAHWQQQWLQGELLDKQIKYWKDQLAGSPPVLELPTDMPRPATQKFDGDIQSIKLSQNLAEGLNALSRKEGVTLFMALLGAFQILLHKYSGQDDILIGSPIAGRTHTALEDLIGFFVNTLVLRANFSNNTTFKELLKQVRQVTLGAYAHQDLPFEKLVEELQPVRDLSHSPLFQVMFVFQNIPSVSVDLPELKMIPFNTNTGISTYDLTLFMYETNEGLTANIEYNTNLFKPATINRMLSHFQNLLANIIEEPDSKISDLALISEKEWQDIVFTWNDTKNDFDPILCIHQRFERQVIDRPDAIALSFESDQVSYSTLNKKANQLARFLKGEGVGPETLVGLCLDKSIEVIIGILGIMKAGGAYVSLDPGYPKERLSHMLKDSDVEILLTQKHLEPALPQNKAKTVCLDADWGKIRVHETENLPNSVTFENLAYIIYTSGTTGRPKGTLLPHRGIVNLIDVMSRDYGVGPDQTILQFASFSFDSSMAEIFLGLLTGARLILASKETVMSAPDLVDLMNQKSITTVILPPSLIATLPDEEVPSLSTMVSAGEACSWEIAERWSSKLKFFNGYGPTECTVGSSWHLVEEVREFTKVSIGSPINNVRIYLLDQHLKPVPIGVGGEVHIGGIGQARGYLNRPDLTAEKFIPDPFSQEDGGRLYKTGDLARYLPNGNMDFLGRIDQQVKIRGFRIELGEIESILQEYKGIKDAVVILRDDTPGNQRIVAYLINEDGVSIEFGKLRVYLRERLPEFMLPSAFVTMEAFPLTPNGKIDRRALPIPDQDRSDLSSEYVAPRNEIEEKMVNICRELLSLERVGVYDNFFDLGGHSLLATQFISRLKEKFRVDIALRTLFEKPMIAELANEIKILQERGSETQIPTIRRASREARRVKLSDLNRNNLKNKS